MLDSLLDSVKGQVIGKLSEVGMDSGQAEQAIPLAGDSIKEGIMGAVTSGNADGVMGLFSSLTGGGDGGNVLQNMVFKNIAGDYVSKLTSQLGLPSGIAETASSAVLPMILNKVKGAASNDAGEVDQNGLMNMLGGDAGSLLSGGVDGLKDQAVDMLKDKMGGIGKLFG